MRPSGNNASEGLGHSAGLPPPFARPAPTHRTKILFVCAQNKIRSYTAEKIFAGSLYYDVKSRGVAKDARIKLAAADLRWADLIFVMEKEHKNRIAKEFREDIVGKKIVCLFIEDIYELMEERLIAILRQTLAPHLHLLPLRHENEKNLDGPQQEDRARRARQHEA